jgi:hypothetical protein
VARHGRRAIIPPTEPPVIAIAREANAQPLNTAASGVQMVDGCK